VQLLCDLDAQLFRPVPGSPDLPAFARAFLRRAPDR
jgi:hypothetical protein